MSAASDLFKSLNNNDIISQNSRQDNKNILEEDQVVSKKRITMLRLGDSIPEETMEQETQAAKMSRTVTQFE